MLKNNFELEHSPTLQFPNINSYEDRLVNHAKSSSNYIIQFESSSQIPVYLRINSPSMEEGLATAIPIWQLGITEGDMTNYIKPIVDVSNSIIEELEEED
jgi:hypothetical protein